MHALYTILYVVGLCALLPRTLWDLATGGRYAVGLGERLGIDTSSLEGIEAGGTWIHAVSVGEVHAARGLLPHLRRLHPDRPVVLSTTTATGQELAESADVDATFYCPLDLPWTLAPILDRLRPRAVLLVETEVWPNLLRACRRRRIPVGLVNARLSARSYRRYRRLGSLWSSVLDGLAVVCARTAREAALYADLGVPDERLYTTGNLKADAGALTAPAPVRRALARSLQLNGSAPVWVAGCTMPGEEEMVLDAFARVRRAHPALRLLLAPRHPERFDRVAEAVSAAGWSCRRRTSGGPEDASVVLLDTMGELPAAYGLGTVSFIGGSLVPTGGHNLLEPAVQAQPIVFGPHMDNFATLAASFRRADAGRCVRDVDELARAVGELLDDPDARRHMGLRARKLAVDDAAVGRRTARVLESTLLAPTEA